MFKGPQKPGRAPVKPAVFLTLSDDDYLEIADLAERDGISMAQLCRTAVRRFLNEQVAA